MVVHFFSCGPLPQLAPWCSKTSWKGEGGRGSALGEGEMEGEPPNRSHSPHLPNKPFQGHWQEALRQGSEVETEGSYTWDAVVLANGPIQANRPKRLGEGAKGLLGRGSKSLKKGSCTTKTLFCTGATQHFTGAKGIWPIAPKGLLHPLPTTLKRFP